MIQAILAKSDEELLEAMPGVRQVERESMAVVVAHLAGMDGRRLYAGLGFSSMFGYLTQGLGYSEDRAVKRLKVARLVRDFPVVFECLVDGRLHLTGAWLLSKQMTEDNCEELIAAASGKTKRDIEELLADREPKDDVATRVRKLPTPRAEATAGPTLFEGENSYPSQTQNRQPARARSTTAPLGQDRFKVSFTASQTLVGKLERLGALLSHQVSPSDLPAVLEKAVDVAIETFEKRRFGARKSLKAKATDPRSRHISARVRREVYARDGGRCTFIAADGRRCDCEERLQFDHIDPYARGGGKEPHELRMRCRTHNLHTAIEDFGRSTMQRYLRLPV